MGTHSGWTDDGVYRQADGSPIYQNAPIDVTTFGRFSEVKNYAIAEGIPIGQAVERLVNRGLSHLSRTYLNGADQ